MPGNLFFRQATGAQGLTFGDKCGLTSASWSLISRSAALEKEVAGFREKIHHLDDMLKSQQRKVRQMIEQVKGHLCSPQACTSIIYSPGQLNLKQVAP